MKSKETIIFLANELGNDGFTQRTFDFYNALAKENNIIFLFGNFKLNLNDYLSAQAKANTVLKFGFHQNYWLEKMAKNYNSFDLKENETKISNFDVQEAQFLRKIIKEHNVKKLYWYAKNDTFKPFYLKKLAPQLNLYPVIDYVVNDENKLWNKLINEQSKLIYYRFFEIKKLFTNPNMVYLPITYNLNKVFDDNSGKIWDIDNNLISDNTFKIGFLNYYDHTVNGLWGLIRTHSNLSKKGFAHKFVILGRSPLFWDNYERDFLNANAEFISEDTIFVGWRDKVKPYLEKMDIVISNTVYNERKFKVSQTILDAICLNKTVVTTNYHEYVNFKKYGVRFSKLNKLEQYIIDNKDELINDKTNGELFIEDMQANEIKFYDTLRKWSN